MLCASFITFCLATIFVLSLFFIWWWGLAIFFHTFRLKPWSSSVKFSETDRQLPLQLQLNQLITEDYTEINRQWVRLTLDLFGQRERLVLGNEQFPHGLKGSLLGELLFTAFAQMYYVITGFNRLWGRVWGREGNAEIQGHGSLRFSRRVTCTAPSFDVFLVSPGRLGVFHRRSERQHHTCTHTSTITLHRFSINKRREAQPGGRLCEWMIWMSAFNMQLAHT